MSAYTPNDELLLVPAGRMDALIAKERRCRELEAEVERLNALIAGAGMFDVPVPEGDAHSGDQEQA